MAVEPHFRFSSVQRHKSSLRFQYSECQQDNELHNEEPCLLIKGHMLMY